ncbi:MAG TPA: hypothetical protein VMM13_05690 [Euzebya sp.]|nr:hypothetical protein [Euzebya sp.]
MNPATCAAPDCDNPVPRRPGPGRPPIYCTPTCRPSRRHGQPSTITIDLGHDDTATTGTGWTLTLRRGPREVTIANNLGRFEAILLHNDLQQLLHPHQKGAATTT